MEQRYVKVCHSSMTIFAQLNTTVTVATVTVTTVTQS